MTTPTRARAHAHLVHCQDKTTRASLEIDSSESEGSAPGLRAVVSSLPRRLAEARATCVRAHID